MLGNNMGLECSLRRRTDHWRITGQIHGGIFGYGILLECRSGSWARTEASASYFKVYSTTKAVVGGTMVESEIWTGSPVRTLRPVFRSEAISE